MCHKCRSFSNKIIVQVKINLQRVFKAANGYKRKTKNFDFHENDFFAKSVGCFIFHVTNCFS